MKKILGWGLAALAAPVAIGSAVMFNPGAAIADPGGNTNALNVVGEPYFKAVAILNSQHVTPTFGGSFGSDLPQSQCIVDQQKATKSGRMLLSLDCTKAAAAHATDSTPSRAGSGGPATPGAPGAPAPGNGQGTFGVPVGVPVPVG